MSATEEDTVEYDFDQLVPADLDGFPIDEATLFLQRLAEDWGELEAGLARPLGWSPLKVRRFLNVPGVKELVWALHEIDNESVERATKRTAEGGNPAAQKLWLFNKAAHRGWADRRTVRIDAEVDHNVVVSVREALEQQTRFLIEGSNAAGVAALQEAIGLAAYDEYDVIDAEVIDE